MPEESNLLEKEEGKTTKKRRTTKRKPAKRKAAKIATEKKETVSIPEQRIPKKGSGGASFITLLITVIVILGVIGVLFGYTKDKFSKVIKDRSAATASLQTQIKQLRQELSGVKDKALTLQEENEKNKQVVIDLLDKNRSLPRTVDAMGWGTLRNDELSFAVSYPETWSAVKPIIKVETSEIDEETEIRKEIVYLQPEKAPNFINAITIKTDYEDFANLDLDEKLDIFTELDSIDVLEFNEGTMIYFININDKDEQVPTILILTEDNIYRATFNVVDKTLERYFDFRNDFEAILTTFISQERLAELDETINDALEAMPQ